MELYLNLMGPGKKQRKTVTAIARELLALSGPSASRPKRPASNNSPLEEKRKNKSKDFQMRK